MTDQSKPDATPMHVTAHIHRPGDGPCDICGDGRVVPPEPSHVCRTCGLVSVDELLPCAVESAVPPEAPSAREQAEQFCHSLSLESEDNDEPLDALANLLRDTQVYSRLTDLMAQQLAAAEYSGAQNAHREAANLCEMQDDIACVVSTHRTDWSWRDVVTDVTALKARVEQLTEALRHLRDKFDPDTNPHHPDCAGCNRAWALADPAPSEEKPNAD